MYTPRECSTAENSLALAAHLGLITVVQQLIEDGVQEVRSDLGHPSHPVSWYQNPKLVSMYLQMKLNLPLQQALCYIPYRFGLNSSDYYPCGGERSRRGISLCRYECLIRDATIHNSLEVVKYLVDALCDDEGYFQDCPRHHHTIHPTLGRNPGTDLRAAAQNCVLVWAAHSGRFDMAQAALGNGADPNWTAISASGAYESILTLAALQGHQQIFNLLLSYGADMRRKTRTPLLSYAATGGSLEIIELCVRSGIETDFPRATLHRAWRTRHPLVAALIRKHCKSCHGTLRLLWRYGIIFDPHSELDQKLCEKAARQSDTKSLAVLEEMREEQQALKSKSNSDKGDHEVFGQRQDQ